MTPGAEHYGTLFTELSAGGAAELPPPTQREPDSARTRDTGDSIPGCVFGGALVAASVLVLGGLPVDEAFTNVENARGCHVPDTPEQRAWVARFALNFSELA